MPAPDHPLFTSNDLTAWLHKPVSSWDAEVVERVVWGWLSPVLGLDERPASLSDTQFAWAVELGAIAHENPAGLDSKSTGPFGEDYSTERRVAILDEAASGGQAGATAMKPRGSFPAAATFPG